MSGLRRASKIIAVVWALALVAAIPYAVYSKIHFVHHPRTNEVNYVQVVIIGFKATERLGAEIVSVK